MSSSRDDLQLAVNKANPGDTIILPNGYTWIGNLVLPVKPMAFDSAGNALWITIKSYLDLADGLRVKPNEPPATLISPNELPVIANDYNNPDFTATPAHHYRFLGITLLTTGHAGSNLNYNLVLLGAPPRNPTLASLPHDIEFHHMYVHGTDDVMNPDGSYQQRYEMVRGFLAETANFTLQDSYVDNFRSTFMEANAFSTINGPGPFTLVNNYLEAAAENVMFCGVSPTIPGLNPTGITIKGNYIAKRLAWRNANPAVYVKNLLEFKDGVNIVVDGNVFENVWQANQSGAAILFTPRTGGYHLESTVKNVMFTNNIVRHASKGFSMGLYDDLASQAAGTNIPLSSLQRSSNITIQNNLLDDISGSKWGDRGIGWSIVSAPDNLVIKNNTVKFSDIFKGPENEMINSGWWMDRPYGEPVGMDVEENLFGWQLYGDSVIGPDSVSPAAIFRNNNVTNIAPWRLGAWQQSPCAAAAWGNSFNVRASAMFGANLQFLIGAEGAIRTGGR